MIIDETSPLHQLTRILANKRRKLVRTPVNNNNVCSQRIFLDRGRCNSCCGGPTARFMMTFQPVWVSIFLAPVIVRLMHLYAETARAKRKPGTVIFSASSLAMLCLICVVFAFCIVIGGWRQGAGAVCIGGLFVMALAEHHRARRQKANREAPLEANPQYFVLGDRIRVSNGRPQGCRLRKG